MSYAQVADLQARFPVTIDPVRAQALLNQAAGDIDSYIGGATYPGATLVQRLGANDRVRPAGGKLLYLPGPTSNVYTVTIEWTDPNSANPPPQSAVLPSTAWLWRPERNTLERVDGMYWPGGAGVTVYYPSGGSATLSPMGLVIPGSWAGVVVNRDTGFAPGAYPQALINVNVAVAARYMSAPPGVDQQRIDNYLVKFQPQTDTILESEKRVLDQWAWNAAELYGT